MGLNYSPKEKKRLIYYACGKTIRPEDEKILRQASSIGLVNYGVNSLGQSAKLTDQGLWAVGVPFYKIIEVKMKGLLKKIEDYRLTDLSLSRMEEIFLINP